MASIRRALRPVLTAVIASSAVLGLGACASKAPPACCATVGYTRAQVESVVGPPSPPQSSKYHPQPSPPPGAAIYTTEHGYLMVSYAVAYHRKPPPVAAALSLDFFEGKDPASAYALIATYLPKDAKDTGMHVIGKVSQDRVYDSQQLAHVTSGHGYIFVDCYSPNPARECDRMQIMTPRRASAPPRGN